MYAVNDLKWFRSSKVYLVFVKISCIDMYTSYVEIVCCYSSIIRKHRKERSSKWSLLVAQKRNTYYTANVKTSNLLLMKYFLILMVCCYIGIFITHLTVNFVIATMKLYIVYLIYFSYFTHLVRLPYFVMLSKTAIYHSNLFYTLIYFMYKILLPLLLLTWYTHSDAANTETIGDRI